jgi:hypothetical protein
VEACNAADLLRGSADDDRQRDEPSVIEVLKENWRAFEVFRLCLASYAGMGGLVGIAATEIHAAVQLLQIPRKAWRSVFHKVHYMGSRLVTAQAEKRAASPSK